jgi:apolipoprotein N-acyltransferase
LKKYHLILLSLLGGVLLTLGWPERGFPGLLFIAMVPFLYIEDHIFRNPERFGKIQVFFTTYIGFFAWNVLTTWWIWNSTAVGSIFAWALNALFMAAVFYFYHLTRRYASSRAGAMILVFFWITFEYLHHNWDGSWPWLSLGSGFAGYNKWVQWYEYTGIFGGTLWILLVNVLFFRGIRNYLSNKPLARAIVPAAAGLAIIFLTVFLSYRLYHRYQEKPWPVDVIVVQPNFDPYTDQFNQGPGESVETNLDLAMQKMDHHADFIVSPESTIQESLWEDRMEGSVSIQMLEAFTEATPDIGIVIGASTFKEYKQGEELSVTARKFRDGNGYYDAYNTALFVIDGKLKSLHHKSKLTPGVEKMPMAKLMKPLESLAINLGGTVGSLGSDAERTVFTRPSDGLTIAPVICYESVYGEYITEYIHKGANLIFVITNDGWWGDTPGHRQHLTFSKLRAIETRRSVARSANTGISCFIDQRGDISQATAYWEPAVIRQEINANDGITFYVRYGDYIARVSGFVTAFLLLFAVAGSLMKKFQKTNPKLK